MKVDDVDIVVKCVAFIAMVAGPPSGPEKSEDGKRRWLWFDEDSDTQVICLVLGENDYRVELDLEAIEAGHPRYYTLIGWCAMHRIPCHITMGDDHSMRVTIETNGDRQHAH